MSTSASYTEPLEIQKSLEEWERILVEKLGPVDERIEESYRNIPLRDGYKIRAKVWRPKADATTPRPVILLFHGGGFGAGSSEQCTRPGRELALEFDAVVISATYRLAPQHKFPQAALDGLDVVRWVIDNSATEFGASPEAGLVVGGYSAGSNVAAVAASEARNRSFKHQITGSFICIPVFFTEEMVPVKYKDIFTSRDDNDAEPMGVESMKMIFSNAQLDATSPLFCPLHHSQGLSGLPRTYVQVGGKDCIRDDGIVYVKLLQDAGVEARVENHEAIGHESWTIWTDIETVQGKELKGKTLDGMRWLLRK